MMTSLANRYYHAGGLLRRALNQAARELLLAQSSGGLLSWHRYHGAIRGEEDQGPS